MTKKELNWFSLGWLVMVAIWFFGAMFAGR
jgi:hypothetical protein